ncbi:hypothetical protein [Vacuolonema iberomarrocanum]
MVFGDSRLGQLLQFIRRRMILHRMSHCRLTEADVKERDRPTHSF